MHDYREDKPKVREVLKEHFVYCNEVELENYNKKYLK